MKKTMMKGASIATLALIAAFAVADPVRVTVNGEPVSFRSAQPQMMRGHVFVPLRGVFEAMGASVDWDPDSQTVMADGGGRHVRLKIGSLDANVNGHIESMDAAPRIYRDTTMVPLRFLSEALGATVDWRPEDDLVAIVSRDEGAGQRFVPPPKETPPPTIVTPAPTVIIERPAAPPPPPPAPPPPPPYVIERDTVIPLRLDTALASNHNQPGDRVEATVFGESGRYLDIPEGTLLIGRVMEAQGASRSHGGILDVRFTHLRLPNGHEYHIDGIVTKLDNANITRTDRGRFVAKTNMQRAMDKETSEARGADMVLEPTKDKPTGGSALGGTAGQFVGLFDHRMAHNVIVKPGTRLALVLDHDIKIDHDDIR